MSGKMIIGCAAVLAALGGEAAEISVTDSVHGPTPAVLAYNLAHFYPGSNVSDWWRFSEVTGARVFLSPEHFTDPAHVPPNDQTVVDQESFLAARERLMAEPLDEQNIDWPFLRDRFANYVLKSNNKIVVDYALGEITRVSPDVLVQISVPADVFAIDGPDDWAGKWTLWRSYFSYTYYYASEYGLERFAMQNEPNHPHSFVEPEAWLMRAALAADAASTALETVNRIKGTELKSKMFVPILAGSVKNIPQGAYARYSRPVLNAWGTDFLGRETGKPLYYCYAHQVYNYTPDDFAKGMRGIRRNVAKDLADGMPQPALALTEFNVHTGKNFDGMPETMDSPEKFTRLGMILGELMGEGLDEFYLFKFGLTQASENRTYPVHKNGMHYCDNVNAPHSYGGPTRGADAYRLFCQAFRPGRDQLELELKAEDELRAYAARDPKTGSVWVYSVNPSTDAEKLALDLSPWAASLAGNVIVTEVSETNGGEVISIGQLEDGRLGGLKQPGESVWLIRLPGSTVAAEWIDVPVDADAMVADGTLRKKKLGGAKEIQVVNDVKDPKGRRAGLFRFTLPDVAADRILAAVVEFPARRNGGQIAQAQVFVSDSNDWKDASVSWSGVPDLRQRHPAGAMLVNRVVQGLGKSVFVAGQLNVADKSYSPHGLDVTELLRSRMGAPVSFMLVQEPRWDVNAAEKDKPGDVQSGGIEVAAREHAGTPSAKIRLLLKTHREFKPSRE